MRLKAIPSLAVMVVLTGLLASVPGLYADTVYMRLEIVGDASSTVDLTDTDSDGWISYSGSIGEWTIDLQSGVGSAQLGPGSMDLFSVNSASGTDTTLRIQFTQTGMTYVNDDWQLSLGGTGENISATYDVWADLGNVAFEHDLHIGTLSSGALGSPSTDFSQVGQGTVSVSGTYSLTQQVEITGNGVDPNQFAADAFLQPHEGFSAPVPEPSSLLLLGMALFALGLMVRRGSISSPGDR